MYKYSIRLANYLEKKSRKIKRKAQQKLLRDFLNKYSLEEIRKPNEKTDIRFNPYEGTSLFLADELIDSKIIGADEKIMDVGCGSGLFLIYLYDKGFRNISGVEMDPKLYELCKKNIHRYCSLKSIEKTIDIFCENAIEMNIGDDVDCFYLFNTFYDQATYAEWLNRVEESLRRKKRDIKIVLLYPTVASMAAMRDKNWLIESERIICKAQICYQCMNFLVYRSK